MNDNDILKKSRKALNASTDALDDDTIRQLRQARRHALHQNTALVKNEYKIWQPLSGFAVIALLLVVIGSWPLQGQEPLPAQALSSIDMELAEANDSFYLYEELEFYQWLDETVDLDAS